MGRSASQRRGDWAEQRALRLLRAAGWNLLAQRWCCRWGELDLLLHKPQQLWVTSCRKPKVSPPFGLTAICTVALSPRPAEPILWR